MADKESMGQVEETDLSEQEQEEVGRAVMTITADEVMSALVATVGKHNVPRAFAALRKGKKNLSDVISEILEEEGAAAGGTTSRYRNFVEPQQGTTDELDPTEVSSTKAEVSCKLLDDGSNYKLWFADLKGPCTIKGKWCGKALFNELPDTKADGVVQQLIRSSVPGFLAQDTVDKGCAHLIFALSLIHI